MTFPDTPLGVAVEFFINSAWTDVTDLRPTYNCYVQGLDGKKAVDINRAKKSGLPLITNLVTFTFIDTNAIMDNDNPLSPYYRKLGPGTPVRIKVNGTVRMTVALVSMVPDFAHAPRVITVTVTATGQYDQTVEGTKSIRSPMRRAYDTNLTRPVAYWPLEGGKDATVLYDTITGAPTEQVDQSAAVAGQSGAVKFGTVSLGVGSESVANIAGSWTLGMRLPTNVVATGSVSLQYAMAFGTEVRTGGLVVTSFRLNPRFTSRHLVFSVYFYDAKNGQIDIIEANSDLTPAVGPTTVATFNLGNIYDGQARAFQLDLTASAGNGVDYIFWMNNNPLASGTYIASFAGPMNAAPYRVASLTSSVSASATQAVGHYAVFTSIVPATTYAPLTAYRGEPAASRLSRVLIAEEDIPYTLIGSELQTAEMGPQPIATVPEIILDCANVDKGMLYESHNALGFTYRTRVNMYSQGPTLRLSHNSSHLSAPFQAVMGGIMDSTIINDMTAKRPGGSSDRAVIPDDDFFHWTTQAPPLGVGVRDSSQDVNVYADDQLDDQAEWIAHLASWREKRFADVTVMLQREGLSSSPATTAAVRALGIMDLIAIDTTGAPKWLPQAEVRLLAEGYNESIAQYNHTFRFYTRPADPYEVTEVDSSGSALASPISSIATFFRVETSLGPVWSEVDEPYHWQINGEAMRVTNITTDTPAFIAAGTVAHGVNAGITPGLPAGMTPDIGQLMILHAAIRNSGAGTVVTPAGWTAIAISGNMKICARYYQAGDVAPFVTFSGSVALADTSARITGWSGLSMQLGGYSNGSKQAPTTANTLNGVTQNIAYNPLTVFRDKCVVFYFGWKQDDWTSVATVAGAEAYEDFTTAGDDQGIVMDYAIQGAHTDIAAGSFVVTGGLTAISRAIVLALRPLQSVTVVRNVNNINTAHAISSAVRGWRMGVNGL